MTTTLPVGAGADLELLVSGLTHDLRNALAVIRALSHVAQSRIRSGHIDAALGALTKLDESGAHATLLCSDVLECGRRRAAQGSRPPVGPVDVAEVVRTVVAHVQGQAPAIEVTGPASVPIESHRRSIERILCNLLHNAVRYGKGAPVEVRLYPAGSWVALTVRDHGCGIAPQALEHLFTAYGRKAVEDASFEHFGLGLWIVKTLVGSLGGTLHVASELGQGTAMTVCLPARPDRRRGPRSGRTRIARRLRD